MFLSESGKEYMALDYNCEIFQCLNDAEKELEIHFAMSRLRNKINNTHPCQIHGNGGPSRKLKLNQYENYLIDCWRSNIIGPCFRQHAKSVYRDEASACEYPFL